MFILIHAYIYMIIYLPVNYGIYYTQTIMFACNLFTMTDTQV